MGKHSIEIAQHKINNNKKCKPNREENDNNNKQQTTNNKQQTTNNENENHATPCDNATAAATTTTTTTTTKSRTKRKKRIMTKKQSNSNHRDQTHLVWFAAVAECQLRHQKCYCSRIWAIHLSGFIIAHCEGLEKKNRNVPANNRSNTATVQYVKRVFISAGGAINYFFPAQKEKPNVSIRSY